MHAANAAANAANTSASSANSSPNHHRTCSSKSEWTLSHHRLEKRGKQLSLLQDENQEGLLEDEQEQQDEQIHRGKKSVVMVKMTDAAIRAIEEYIKIAANQVGR